MACQSDPFCCQRFPCCAAPTCTVPCVLPHPVPPPAPPPSAAFQAAAAANQSLAAGVAAQLLFQYPTTANALVYTPLTSVFQAPTSGAYLFTANVAWSSATAGAVLTLSLNVAGLDVLSTTSIAPTVGVSAVAALSGVVTLAAGQVVTLRASCPNAATVLGQVPAPAALTWFGGARAA